MRALAIAALLLVTSAARAQGLDAPLVEVVAGEGEGSTRQREVIERWARLAALRVRLGDHHADAVRERDGLRAAIAALRAARTRVDRAAVARWLRGRIADVDARLAELAPTCSSGHPNVRTGQARRDALAAALATVERRGLFVPTLAP